MLGTLRWEDISDLSLFKCKICKYRLQYPVMEVQTFGWICGSCYEKSGFTNVTENTDVETILSKLYIPCKYSEKGCSFDGSLQKISEHEKQSCPFRDKLCPFSLISECDTAGTKDVVEHIKKEHEDYFINVVVEENCITIQDPMEMKCVNTNPDTFYLFEFQDKPFLFHSKVDVEQQNYNCLLYHFNDSETSENITFCLVIEQGTLTLKSNKINAVAYTKISNMQESNNVATLANMGYVKEIKILISSFPKLLIFYSCIRCEKHMIDKTHICTSCDDVQICNDCYKQNSTCSKCSNSFTRPLNIYTPILEIKCSEVDGCNEFVPIISYESHRKNCRFNTYKCAYAATTSDCKWTGFYADMSAHILLEHNTLQAVNNLHIKVKPGDQSYTTTIIKNTITVKCRYRFQTNNKLSWKIAVVGPAMLANLYVWELQLKNKNSRRSINVSGICDKFNDNKDFKESIDVSNFIIDNKVEFDICIHNSS